MTPQLETKEQTIQGEFTTAEVTHIIESLELEGDRYLHNHLLMTLSGEERVVREFHDKVTRPNLERLMGVAEEMGIPLPFTMPVEKRENEIRSKLEGGDVRGVLSEGEVIRNCLIGMRSLSMFYMVSLNLATHDKVREAFRRNHDALVDQMPRVEQAFRNTREFVAPPVAKSVRLEGAIAKGVKPGEARGAVAGGRTA